MQVDGCSELNGFAVIAVLVSLNRVACDASVDKQFLVVRLLNNFFGGRCGYGTFSMERVRHLR